MEFLLVFAFSLIIILPLIYLLNSEYTENKGNLDQSQLRQIMDEISIATRNTYYTGYPSRTTLEFYFPRGIKTISSTAAGSKSELVFVIDKSGTDVEIVESFPFVIETCHSIETIPCYNSGNTEDIRTNSGRRRILIQAGEVDNPENPGNPIPGVIITDTP
jgi:uncharacterized protein (UPF0333 family)